MLSAAALLDLWERELPPAERAVEALAVWSGAYEAATLPLDELNRRLLDMRAAEFGDALAFYAECTRCGAAVEFDVLASSLVDTPRGDTADGSLCLGELTVTCRPPSTVDVVAASESDDARRTLLERCVISATTGTTAVPAAELSDVVVAAVESFLDERHPLLDITFAIECTECGDRWSEMLDVAAHLWDDIDARARRLLGEVALLARAYGWTERDVLDMTVQRRAHYLELVS